MLNIYELNLTTTDKLPHPSVMAKLPPTSYVRMVDIWLIFAQLIPFIEVILLTIMEKYRKTASINHHGQPRMVDNMEIHVPDNEVIVIGKLIGRLNTSLFL